MATRQLRGLSAIRLSVLTDDTTSPTRQRDANHAAADALNIDLGDREAVDLDISALKYSPFDRPELGKWLAKPTEYDAIIWWRFDRAIASMADMHDLGKWARDHKKMLIFAEGIGGGSRMVVDFSNPLDPMSQLQLTMFAFAAQVERVSTHDRVTGAHAALRNMALRWKGGAAPYGYKPEKMTAGWTLVQDPDQVKILTRIITSLLSVPDTTPNSLANELTREGIVSPAGASEKRSGAWSGSSIKAMLLSPAMLGWKTYKGNVVRDSEGVPVPFTAEPILDRAEYDRLKAVLKAREKGSVTRRKGASLLLDVLFCAGCERKMYADEGRYGRGSNSRLGFCDSPAYVKAEWIEAYVERKFLHHLGGIEVREYETVAGYDPEPEIEEVTAEYTAHLAQQGKQKSRAAQAAWQAHADALDKRLAELESAEKTEDRRVTKNTGISYAKKWRDGDTAARRQLLLDAEVRVTVKSAGRSRVYRLDESRVDFEIGNEELAAISDEILAQVEISEEAV